MGAWDRSRLPDVIAALSAFAAFLLAAAVVLWFLVRPERRPTEPQPVEIEAEGPQDEPIVVPAPGDEDGPIGVGIAEAEERVAAKLAGELPTAPLEDGLRVSALDVAWDDPEGRPFFRAEAVVGVLDAGALGAGDVLVSEATLRDAELFLERREGDERWNYQRVLAVFEDEEPPAGAVGAETTVRLRDVEIENGLVVVRPPGPDEYRFGDVDALVPLAELAVPEQVPRIEVERLFTTAVIPGQPGSLAVSVAAAVVTLPDDVVVIDAERLGVDGSVATEVVVEYDPEAPGYGLAAVARVERLEFPDVEFLVSELPPEGVAEFGLVVERLADARTAVRLEDVVATADGSRVVGDLVLSVAPEAATRIVSVDASLEPVTIAMLERYVGPLPYSGTLRGTVRGGPTRFVFDITGLLSTPELAEPFTAELAGALTLTEDRLALEALDVDLRNVPLEALRPLAPGLPLRGRISGRISLRGPPDVAPLVIDVRLDLPEGSVLVAGQIDLTGPVPAYDLSGRLIAVNLAAVLEPEVPPVALTARFTLVGRGLDPATANARIALAGLFTGWETGPADTVRIRAAIADGTLRLDAAALRLATLSLTAEGSWRFVAPAGGGLGYRLDIASLRPFAPYLPGLEGVRASGALVTTGIVSGTLETPRFVGELEGDRLELGAWAAEELEATYDVALTEPLPRATVRAVARGLAAPGAARYEVATAELIIDEPRFALEIEADRTDDGDLELSADGRILEDGRVEAVVRRFNVDLDDQRWTLERTAMVDWIPGDGLRIRALRLLEVDGEGRVAIDGWLPPTAAVALRVEVRALPVGEVLELLGREPTVTGDLWIEARALGPPETPRITADFRLLQGRVGETFMTRLEGAVLYEAERLAAEATAVLDTLGTVELTASLPVSIELDLIPSARVLEDLPLSAALRADSIPLAAVTMLTPEIRDAEGALRADVRLTGTPAVPRLDGTARVWNGAATVPALNQRYEQISADIVFEDRRAIVREVRARSDGWAVASGTVTFPSLTEPVVDLEVDFDGFRAIGVEDREDAGVWGELRITGDLAAPVVTGDVTLDDGDVVVPSFGNGDVDTGLVGDGESPLEPIAELDEPEPVPWFERVAFEELIVEAGDALWFVTEQARVQLTGELVLVKAATQPVRIFGELEGDRGTFTLRIGPLVRRFDIVSARIRFFGTPEPNPAIDIVASRIVPSARGEPVEIRLVIGGTVDAPTVAIRTAEGANIPESELLSFLLFGQPSFALADGGAPITPVLEEAVFGVGSLAELASIELEETLIADIGLPLDYFQIRPTPGPVAGFGAPEVAFGRELADDVFLTVNAGLAGVLGTDVGPDAWTATIHWRIDPEWSLEFGIAPVTPGVYPGLGAVVPVTNPEQQFIIELVRRWTY